MTEPKPFASLTPTLLARKGGARPAMRPQLAPLTRFHEATARQFEDLGWNDMGGDAEAAKPEEIEQPEVHEAEVVSLNGAAHFDPQPEPQVPEVLRQRESVAASVSRLDAPRRSALAEGRRAAFTLRLDSERHLQLRLACTISNRSAQQIVTEALDRLLAGTPDIAALADSVRKRG
jgi:hypothetical protein